ncbi:hypothetical protein C9J01_04100 [Photobacterium rosenbergii]|uniref:Uncharacterized protein n=1 Tax=Photobacterium rosenbergii TaxID=294936 RepID=A0A2T3NL73_9GAMM|nr:hypothetical protein C9J01_04100 [Photobacterium rosenbergii]
MTVPHIVKVIRDFNLYLFTKARIYKGKNQPTFSSLLSLIVKLYDKGEFIDIDSRHKVLIWFESVTPNSQHNRFATLGTI